MNQNNDLHEKFRIFSNFIAKATGSVWAFTISVLIVVIWAAFGPLTQYSDTWQLIINTSTTVLTFWMVFIIQNTQNRNARETQLKLDVIIKALDKAGNEYVGLEKFSDKKLQSVEKKVKIGTAKTKAKKVN